MQHVPAHDVPWALGIAQSSKVSAPSSPSERIAGAGCWTRACQDRGGNMDAATASVGMNLVTGAFKLVRSVFGLVPKVKAYRAKRARQKDFHAMKEKLKWRHNAFWLTDQGDEESGPYCAACFQGEGERAVRMVRVSSYYAVCPVCKNGVDFADRPRQPIRRNRPRWIDDW